MVLLLNVIEYNESQHANLPLITLEIPILPVCGCINVVLVIDKFRGPARGKVHVNEDPKPRQKKLLRLNVQQTFDLTESAPKTHRNFGKIR